MIPTLTTEQMAEVDRLMIEEYRISLIQMMENAGRNLAEQVHRICQGNLIGRNIIVLCGRGNNGGGGMVAARHLHNRGAALAVKLVGDVGQLKEISAHQWAILRKLGIPGTTHPFPPPTDPALIIDAMIGYGLKGDIRGDIAMWIDWANQSGAEILALDTPSGLDTTTGNPAKPCIRATQTLTLALPKVGLLAPQARPYVGKLFLADISVPVELYKKLGLEIGPIFADDSIIPVL